MLYQNCPPGINVLGGDDHVLEIVFGDDLSGKIPENFYKALYQKKVDFELFTDENGYLIGINFKIREENV